MILETPPERLEVPKSDPEDLLGAWEVFERPNKALFLCVISLEATDDLLLLGSLTVGSYPTFPKSSSDENSAANVLVCVGFFGSGINGLVDIAGGLLKDGVFVGVSLLKEAVRGSEAFFVRVFSPFASAIKSNKSSTPPSSAGSILLNARIMRKIYFCLWDFS